jgi:hypothetical protein
MYRDFILEHTKLVAISRVVADIPAYDFLGCFLALQCLVDSLPDRTGPLMDDCVVPLSPKSTTTYGLGVVPCYHTELDGLMEQICVIGVPWLIVPVVLAHRSCCLGSSFLLPVLAAGPDCISTAGQSSHVGVDQVEEIGQCLQPLVGEGFESGVPKGFESVDHCWIRVL